jgi:hypothetical protein
MGHPEENFPGVPYRSILKVLPVPGRGIIFNLQNTVVHFHQKTGRGLPPLSVCLLQHPNMRKDGEAMRLPSRMLAYVFLLCFALLYFAEVDAFFVHELQWWSCWSADAIAVPSRQWIMLPYQSAMYMSHLKKRLIWYCTGRSKARSGS